MSELTQTFDDLQPKEKMLIDTHLYRERCEAIIALHNLGRLDELKSYDVPKARADYAQALASGAWGSRPGSSFSVDEYLQSAVALQKMIDTHYSGRAKDLCDALARELTYLPNLRVATWLEKMASQPLSGFGREGGF